MGEIADMMIDGLICQQCCGAFDDEGSGYPRTCAECKSDNDSKHDQVVQATEEFDAASFLAANHNMALIRYSENHYQLRHRNVDWIINIYPSNQRLYHDRNRSKPPYLHMPDSWSLMNVVNAAVEIEKSKSKGMQNAD